MHQDGIAGTEAASGHFNPPPAAGNVRGLGVVDALCVDLEPAHLRWLPDALRELDTRLNRSRTEAKDRYDALHDFATERRSREARQLEQEVGRREYQLRALAMMNDQVAATPEDRARDSTAPDGPRPGVGNRRAIVGPAPLMREVIAIATGMVLDELRDALGAEGYCHDDGEAAEGRPISASAAARILWLTRGAHAMTETLVRLRMLEVYCFDPAYDPIRDDELEPG
jgi:hypothetical protein